MNLDDGYYNPIDTEDPDEPVSEEIVEDEEGTEDDPMETDGEEVPDVDIPEEGDDDPIGNIVGGWLKNQSAESEAPRGEELELLTSINESKFLKELIRLRKSGYTDEQIQRGLGATYSKMYGEDKRPQAQEEDEPQELDLTDPRTLAAFIQQQVQSAITPLAKQREEETEYE
jgi:hypothetical protein